MLKKHEVGGFFYLAAQNFDLFSIIQDQIKTSKTYVDALFKAYPMITLSGWSNLSERTVPLIASIILLFQSTFKTAWHDAPLHDVQAQQPPPAPAAGGENDLYSYRRGDIPIFNFDEADRILIATLQELIEVRLSIFPYAL